RRSRSLIHEDPITLLRVSTRQPRSVAIRSTSARSGVLGPQDSEHAHRRYHIIALDDLRRAAERGSSFTKKTSRIVHFPERPRRVEPSGTCVAELGVR